MPRVLYWTQLFRPYVGGVEVVSTRLLPALTERGYDFAVITSHGSLELPDEETYDGIPIHRLPFNQALAGRDVRAFGQARQRVARIKAAFRPDLVHINLSDPSVLFHLETAAAWPATLLVTLRVALPERGGGAETLLGTVLREADWVTANSRAMLDDARRLAPAIAPRSSVVYSVVDPPELEPAPLPFDRPRLLCVGRMVADKGFDLAITAFASLAGRFEGARLILGGDGPERPELERLARDRGIADRVEFLGWVAPEQIPALINTSTVFIMPSRWREASGLVTLQAAQMARPIVATRVGGLPESVQDWETGLLVDREDSRGLADAVAYLLDHPRIAADMGQAARRRAGQVFNWDVMVSTFDRIYQQLLRDRSDVRPG